MLRRCTTLAAAAAVLFVACGRTWLPDSGTPVQEAGAPDATEQVDAPAPTEAAVPEAAPPDANEASPPPVVACPNAPGLQAKAPWPTTRRCPGRTASTPFSGPQRAPGIAWSQMAAMNWDTEPVIAADGTVYAIDGGRGLVAFSPAGRLRWATPLGPRYPGGIAAAPSTLAIGVDGSVFAIGGAFDRIQPDGTNEGYFDPLCDFAGVQPRADGSADWLGWNCGASLTVEILTEPAMGPDAGVLFWNSGLHMQVSRPSYGPGGQLYFVGLSEPFGGTGVTNVFALVGDWKQGWSWAWSVPTDVYYVWDSFDSNFAWPIVRDDGSIVFADSTGLHAVSAGGAPLWNVASAGTPGALAAGPDGTVYYGSPTGGLVAVSPSGTTVTQLGGVTQADRPIVDGQGTVYAGAAGGIIAIASDGTKLWQTSAAATPLAIDAMGTLYALDATGQVLSALR